MRAAQLSGLRESELLVKRKQCFVIQSSLLFSQSRFSMHGDAANALKDQWP